MQPTEVRRQILGDHDELRRSLGELEELARQVDEGERHQIGDLRAAGERFLERLLEHMGWEDRYLRPALLEADAWGQERAARLDREHAEQRMLLAHVLEELEDQSRPAPLVARTLLDLAKLLREDMEVEERDTLDPRVLRDDVVGVDVETG